MQPTSIKQIKQGEFFKRKPDAKTVYVRGKYDAGSASYSAHKFNDINSEIFIKRNKVVYIHFEF